LKRRVEAQQAEVVAAVEPVELAERRLEPVVLELAVVPEVELLEQEVVQPRVEPLV
jgi:hypothetical protein